MLSTLSRDSTPESAQGQTPTRDYGAIGTAVTPASRNTAKSSLTTVTPTNRLRSGLDISAGIPSNSPFRNARLGTPGVYHDNYNEPFSPANGPSMAFQAPVLNLAVGSGRPLPSRGLPVSSGSLGRPESIDPFIQPAANDQQRRVMNMLQSNSHFESRDTPEVIHITDPLETPMPGSLGMLESSFDALRIAVQTAIHGNSTANTGSGFPAAPSTPLRGQQASKTGSSSNTRGSFETSLTEGRILIQVGVDEHDHDNHASTYMDPVNQLEALHIAAQYAKHFGNVVRARMLALPIRPGRTVITIEVVYMSEKLARRVVEANRERSVHGITSLEIRAFLPGGAMPSTTYRIWACNYNSVVFDERRCPMFGSSFEEDASNNYAVAMQRRWLGNYHGLAVKRTPTAIIEAQAERVSQLDNFHKKALTLPIGNLRHRRHFRTSSRGSSEMSNEEIYYLHVLDILAGRDIRSSVMIKNLPITVSAIELKYFLDYACFGLYDFSYLRMDFTAGTNIGYAFVNFNDSAHIITLAFALMFKRFPGADRSSDLSYAAFQGRDALIGRFRNSAVMGLSWSIRPHLWFTHGHPNCGAEEDFPACNNHMKYRNSQKNIANEGLYNGGNNRSPNHRQYGRKWSSPSSHKKNGYQSHRGRNGNGNGYHGNGAFGFSNGNYGYGNGNGDGNYGYGNYGNGSFGSAGTGMDFVTGGSFYSSPTRKGRGY